MHISTSYTNDTTKNINYKYHLRAYDTGVET